MNNTIQNNMKVKPNYKTTIKTQDKLYEMVYNKTTNKTEYHGIDNITGKLELFLEEVEVGGIKYKPLPVTHTLVEKNIVRFASHPLPYNSDEEILSEIRTFIHKYLEITETFEEIASYYVMFTWIHDKFNEVPYLRAIGDFGSGKSRFLETIGSLCYKPIFTGGATSASPIFRILNEVGGTLIIDEADFRVSDTTADIVKILNSGYQRGISVLKTEGKGVYEVKAYDVYGPKIVATRDQFQDKALESRFFVEEMGRSKLRDDIPRNLDETFHEEAEMIKNKLLMWRLKNYFKDFKIKNKIIEGVHPRLNQILLPILTIVDSQEVKDRLEVFIRKYNSELVEDRGLTWESEIVFAILKIEHLGMQNILTVKEITAEVNRDIEAGEDTLQARKIGWYLRSKLQLKTNKTRRGYELDIKSNRSRLDFWKERFGITDKEIKGEHVNDVNVVNVIL